jgi:hypothetical protein
VKVFEAKRLTGEWLGASLDALPGIIGAHFVGSITGLADEDTFPLYNDVDLHLIFEAGSTALESHGPFPNILEVAYKGLMLEGGYKPAGEYESPEAVLANPEIAHHLTMNSVLYDPEGRLQRLQKVVRRDYPRRQWVMARVEHERRGLQSWQAIRAYARAGGSGGLDEFSLLGYHLTYLTALVCVATLRSPTSALYRLGEMLAEKGRPELYDEAVEILGVNRVAPEQFEPLLQEGGEAFDLAVQVRRSPDPFQHKLSAHQRPYFVEKCRSLMAAGHWEHAVGWLLNYYAAASRVILADGPEAVKPFYARRRDELAEMVGFGTAEAAEERTERMVRLDERFFELAEALIAANPRVIE